MSDDRSSILPADHHQTSRRGAFSPLRVFLAFLLSAPMSAHTQSSMAPNDPMPTMPMHGEHIRQQPGPATAIQPSSSLPGGTSSGQSATPSVAGPGLAHGIPEEQANKQFGVEGVLTTARANTQEVTRHLERPVSLDVSFTGPLSTVRKQRLESSVRGYGVAEINEDTLHDAVITQSGVVRGLYVFPGMEVKAGDPLTSVFSPERVNAQHMFLADFSKDEGNQLSLQYYASFSSTQKYLEQSRSNLRWWGFSDNEIDTLLKTGQIKEDYVLQADQDGYILETLKNPGAVVVAGNKSEENFVIPGEQIMRMAKLDTVWGMSFVEPQDYSLFKLGDAIGVTVGEGSATKSVQGLVVHKHDSADPATRKADFHLLLENNDRSIAPGTLISFTKPVPQEGFWIPEKSLLYVEGRPTVIRKTSTGFEAVNVSIGFTSSDLTQVLDGLSEGDEVAAAPRAELDPDARLPGLEAWE